MNQTDPKLALRLVNSHKTMELRKQQRGVPPRQTCPLVVFVSPPCFHLVTPAPCKALLRPERSLYRPLLWTLLMIVLFSLRKTYQKQSLHRYSRKKRCWNGQLRTENRVLKTMPLQVRFSKLSQKVKLLKTKVLTVTQTDPTLAPQFLNPHNRIL